MKKNISFLFLIILFAACKENKTTESKELPVVEKIAHAHGFEKWDAVNEIQFKFGENRFWEWKPKTDDIKLTTNTDTISYNRKSMNSTAKKIDRAFINDKFWLLIPFQLIWDTSATISESVEATAPVSKTTMNKITVTYPKKGGYTPGDAYDIFYDNNYFIKEWVYRKGNSHKPTVSNTFENLQDFNGIKIALDHKKNDGNPIAKLSKIKITYN